MGAFNAVLDTFGRPAVNVVDEILDGSRDLANIAHRGADTFIEIMSTTFAVSFSIVGALIKAGTAVLFYLFVSYAGYEITFYTQDALVQILAGVVILLGALPIVAGIVIGLVAIIESLDRQKPPLRKRKPSDWPIYCFLNLLIIFVICLLHGPAKLTFHAPLLVYVQNLVESVAKAMG